MQIVSGASFHPNPYSSFNPSSQLMQIHTGASFHPKKCPFRRSYSKLMQNVLLAALHVRVAILLSQAGGGGGCHKLQIPQNFDVRCFSLGVVGIYSFLFVLLFVSEGCTSLS